MSYTPTEFKGLSQCPPPGSWEWLQVARTGGIGVGGCSRTSNVQGRAGLAAAVLGPGPRDGINRDLACRKQNLAEQNVLGQGDQTPTGGSECGV